MTDIELTSQKERETALTILEAMARELEAYIVSNEVYRTLLVESGAGNNQFKMSGGDVLARMAALAAVQAQMPAPEKERLAQAVALVETTKYALRSRFHDLLRRELKSRQGTLQWAMDERSDEDGEVASPAERQNRQRIAAIRKELGPSAAPTEEKEVDELDLLEEQLQQALNELNKTE